MELSTFLAQIFGIYLIVEGIAFLVKRKMIIGMFKDLGKNERMMWAIGSFEFLVGLVLVITHNIWSGPLYVVLVTIISWLILIEGASYALLPKSVMQQVLKFFSQKNLVALISLIILLAGFYLAYAGFGVNFA